MVLGEIVEVVGHHRLHATGEECGVATTYLNEQALLQRARSHTGGIKLLQYLDHCLYLFLTDIYIIIDSQFVGNIVG